MSGSKLLELVDVHVKYNHAIVALAGVSLTVRTGEVVSLLGANGAGKSTTLKLVANLLPLQRGRLTAGQVLLDSRDAAPFSATARVRMGIVHVLEGRHCFQTLSIEENLRAGAIGGGASRAQTRQLLEKIYAIFPRLKDKRHQKAGLASGGEQQMTAIGRALMTRPRLLVLDEPSMGLAPLVVRDIFQVLQRINREDGVSILIAEQNSTVALEFSDRAVVMENGTVALGGSAAELRRREDIKAFYLGLDTPHRPANRIAPVV